MGKVGQETGGILKLAMILIGGLLTALAADIPGGVATVGLGEFGASAPKAYLGDRPVRVARQKNGEWAAVVGIDLSAKSNRALAVVHTNARGERVHTAFGIRPHDYPEQRIRIDKERYVFPSQEELERIAAESKRLKARLERFTPEILGDLSVTLPVKGRVSGTFGTRRFFNDEPRSPHGGTDLAAPRHTPVKAAQSGLVALVDDFFFCGKFVLIDHGQGFYTTYCHLEKSSVKTGQKVKQGQKVGTVGSSGRATGPHLHWGVNLNGAWVDPRFLRPQSASSGSKTKSTK